MLGAISPRGLALLRPAALGDAKNHRSTQEPRSISPSVGWSRRASRVSAGGRGTPRVPAKLSSGSARSSRLLRGRVRPPLRNVHRLLRGASAREGAVGPGRALLCPSGPAGAAALGSTHVSLMRTTVSPLTALPSGSASRLLLASAGRCSLSSGAWCLLLSGDRGLNPR